MWFKSCFVVGDMAWKNRSAAWYLAHPGFHRRGVEQKDEPARDVYPQWVRVCLIYMKGIPLSSGRHSGENTLGAAAREGCGACLLPPSLAPSPPRSAARVCPSLQHHLAGPGAGDPGESSGGLLKEIGYVSPCGCNFPRLGCPWTPLDTRARRCSRSGFADVLHELGKSLCPFLLWLSHLCHTCHGSVRLIGCINKGKWPRNPELRSADKTVLLLIAWFALCFWCGFTILLTTHQGKCCACVPGQLCCMCPGQSRECLFRVKK